MPRSKPAVLMITVGSVDHKQQAKAIHLISSMGSWALAIPFPPRLRLALSLYFRHQTLASPLFRRPMGLKTI